MRWLLALLAFVCAMPAAAQAPVADPALTARVAGLIAILDGGGDYDGYFAPRFKAEVSKAQLQAVTEQLTAALGKPLRIGTTKAITPRTASVTVAYERGAATIDLAVDAAPPYPVIGLIVRGTSLADDDIAKLTADFRALPGRSGFGIYTLDNAEPRAIAELNGADAAPIASAFKLWILPEAARQVRAGRRRWTDVIPLGAPSLPSGITQTWPARTPVTLQALATLMISISDNTAADTLLLALDRDRIEAVARADGAADATFPVLTTREAFALKADAARTARWAAADAPARRAMLLPLATARIDAATFADKPVAIDSVEWFASPAAMARTLRRFVTTDPVTRTILATNPGTDPATAARFDYIGYKGGSEPGVISASFLVRRKDGGWRAVTGNWHRAEADTSTLTFLALMNRALALAAR